MPLITTAGAVIAIWAGLELMGKVIAEETVKHASLPITKTFAEWVKKLSGWDDKNREAVFRSAYYAAEELLIKEIGIVKAYRVFRLVDQIVDKNSKRENLIMAILEVSDSERNKILSVNDSGSFVYLGNWGNLGSHSPEEINDLSLFTKYLRQTLLTTEVYQPLIDAYAMEDAKEIREQIHKEIIQISSTIDNDLHAIRVKIIEAGDFQEERKVYLKQIQAFFAEQEFIGFPDLREQKSHPLLEEIFIPLRLQYQRGGEKFDDDMGKLLATIVQGEKQE
jgi:hypothetical protein